MKKKFPLEFTLVNGTHVTIVKTTSNTYEFDLASEEGKHHRFIYVDDGRTKNEAEQGLNFDELDALRRFWLETEDII